MRRFQGLVLSAFLLPCLLLSGCAKKEEGVGPTPTGPMVVGVVKGEGKPLEGARVEIEALGVSSETAADGSFKLTDLVEGVFTIRIEKEGYVERSVEVTVGAEGTVNIGEVELLLAGGIEGTARMEGEQSHKGIKVRILELKGVEAETDSEGRYSISGIAPGKYTLEIEAFGYDPKRISVEVEGGKVTSAEEVLFKGPRRMVGDIGIFCDNTSWIDVGEARRIAERLVTGVTSAKSIAIYDLSGIADFARKGIGDGDLDVIITFGYFPETLYPPGNSQPDGSLAEKFLEDGNMFLNTADYIFYVTQGGGANAVGGLQNMMDIPGITMWGDNTPVSPTKEGLKYMPSLSSYPTWRPFHLDELRDPWVVEIAFAVDGSGTRADPVVVKDKTTGGRIGIAFQVGSDKVPESMRTTCLLELLNNWLPEAAKSK
jgi:hypothetical protein